MQNPISSVTKKEPKIEVSSCNELWISVIDQALVDALSNSQRSRNKKNKIRAIKWLLWDNENFDEVCQLASLDSETVRAKVIQIIASDTCSELNLLTILKISNVDKDVKNTTIKAIYDARKKGMLTNKKSEFKINTKYYHLRHNYNVLRQLMTYQ